MEDDEPKTPSILISHRVPAHLARRFHQICLGVTAELLARQDMNQLQWGVLAAIAEEPGRGQRYIAKRVGIDPVSLGQITDFLEEKGLVQRRPDPEDRRAWKLFITRRGADLRHRLRPSLLEIQERVLAPLNKAERAALLDMLARVIDANECYARPGNGRRRPSRRIPSQSQQ